MLTGSYGFKVPLLVVDIPTILPAPQPTINSYYRSHLIRSSSKNKIHFRDKLISVMAEEDLHVPASTMLPFIAAT